MSKYLRIVGGLALTGLFLWLALRNVNLANVGAALRSARYGFLLPAALCSFTGYLVRTARWGRILGPTRRIHFHRLYPVLMAGFAANNLLPARIGELARAYLLGGREGVSRSLALATIVVERVCDGITLIALMTLALVLFPLPVDDPKLHAVEVSATAIFGVATVALIGLLLFPLPVLALARALARPLPRAVGGRIEALIDSFLQGLTALRSPQALWRIAGLSVVIWLLEGGSYACVLKAFPFGLAPSEWLAAAVFLLVFVNLGIMIPAAPGYIGTYQFFATLALGAFGVAASAAFGLSVVSHALQYVLVTAIGLVCFWRLGLSPGRLGALAPAATAAGPEDAVAAPPATLEVAD